MEFLQDKRRMGALAILSTLLGAALVIMSGTAQAGTYPCGDEPYPEDVTVDIGGMTYVGLDRTVGAKDAGVWVCYGATGGDTNDYNTGAGFHEQSSTPGGTAEVLHCSPSGSCAGFEHSGAEVNPATGTNQPGDGDSTTAGSVGTGSGTCTWIDGSMSCPGSATVAGVTVNEADLVTLNTPGTGCWLGANTTCVVQNTGIGIGRDAGKTVTVDSTISTVGTKTADIPPPGQCVQFGATC